VEGSGAGGSGSSTPAPNSNGLRSGDGFSADPTSVASGCAGASNNSVASGCAQADDGSVASGDAIAVGGSVASGCSIALDGSTSSGGSCTNADADEHHLRRRHTDGHSRSGHDARGAPRTALARTGASVGPLVGLGALLMLLGGLLLFAARRRWSNSGITLNPHHRLHTSRNVQQKNRIRPVNSSKSNGKSGHTSIAGRREIPCAVLGESVRGPQPAYDVRRQVVVRSKAGKAARLRTDVLSSDLVPDMVVEVQHRKGMSMRIGNAGTGRVKSAIGLVGASTAAILVFLGAGPAVADDPPTTDPPAATAPAPEQASTPTTEAPAATPDQAPAQATAEQSGEAPATGATGEAQATGNAKSSANSGAQSSAHASSGSTGAAVNVTGIVAVGGNGGNAGASVGVPVVIGGGSVSVSSANGGAGGNAKRHLRQQRRLQRAVERHQHR
jgi:hypothetical protein